MGPLMKAHCGIALINPRFFFPNGDLLEWRKRVGRVINLLKEAHNSKNDRSFHTFLRLPDGRSGQTLYACGLPREQQSIADDTQAKGLIDYMHTGDPVKAALNVLNLFAVDPLISKIARYISSFRHAISCRRLRYKAILVSVSFLQGLAAMHLEDVNVSLPSQVGKVLAIMLLNNASLSESTLDQCTLQLFALADVRMKKMSDQGLNKANKANIDDIKLFVVQNFRGENNNNLGKESC